MGGTFLSYGVSLIVTLSLFSNIELKLVKEWRFNEEVREVKFEEVKGRIYPEIIILKNGKVEIFDDKRKITEISFVKNTNVYLSPSGCYLGGLVSVEKGERKTKVKFALFTHKGMKIGETVFTVDPKGVGERIAFISDSGNYVLADAGNQKLWFYDKTGTLIKKVDIFENDEWDIAKDIEGIFIGDKLIIVADRRYRSLYTQEIKHERYLMVFTAKGEKLWERFLKECIDKASISVGPGFIGVVICDECFLYTLDGNFINKYPARLCRFLKIKNQYFMVLAEHNRINIISLPETRSFLEKEFEWQIDPRRERWKWIVDIRSSKNAIVLLLKTYTKKKRRIKTIQKEVLFIDLKKKESTIFVLPSGEEFLYVKEDTVYTLFGDRIRKRAF